MVALGKFVDERPVLRAAMVRGSRPEAVAATIASQCASSPASHASGSELPGDPGDGNEQADPAAAAEVRPPGETSVGPFPADVLDPEGIAVNVEQALIIGDAIEHLPRDLDSKLVDLCEAELIKLAAVYEPTVLRSFADRILDYVAPEIAEAALAEKLEREEAAARRKRVLDDYR